SAAPPKPSPFSRGEETRSDRRIDRPATACAKPRLSAPPLPGSASRRARVGELTHAAAIAPGMTASHGRVTAPDPCPFALSAKKSAEKSAAGARPAYAR